MLKALSRHSGQGIGKYMNRSLAKEKKHGRTAFAARLISLLIAVLLAIPAGASFAYTKTENSGTNEVLMGFSEMEYLTEGPADETGIWFSFLDTKNEAFGYEFPYSDSYFRSGSDKFSIWHARGSLALSLSAFRCTSGVVEPQYKTYLRGAGFGNFSVFGYDESPTEDSLSGIIGMKKIDNFTVIAAVTCGQGYGKEWAGNLKVGNGERHEGFSSAAELLEHHLSQYKKDNNIKGKTKLWLTGISRAAAVANITAADAIESGEYNDVYAYLFGVPRTTKAPIAYSGIYNICGQYDPVAETPFPSWGYERYGIDLYTPAQESDIDYEKHSKAAAKVGDRFAGSGFRNNPEVNYQLRLVMETIDEIFRSSEEYSERLQPLIIKAMGEHDETELTGILRDAVRQVVPEDPQERAQLTQFIDYLSYMAGQHMRANPRQIAAGSWDPDEAMEANLVIEHRPVTYVKWLFADIDPQELFSTGTESRRITFLGDAGIVVKKDGTVISEIDSKGNILVPDSGEGARGKGVKGVFLMRNGRQTVLNLPTDADFVIDFEFQADSTLTIFDILVSPQLLRSRPGRMYIGRAVSGLYRMNVRANSSPDRPQIISEGDRTPYFSVRAFTYSPTVVMSDELNAARSSYLSLSSAVMMGFIVINGLNILLILCVLIYIIHRFKVRRGHQPYSDWYVIVPHLVFIAVFAAMTQYAAFYMFTFGSARAQCAAATILVIFLLALRGAIRSRKESAFLISAVLLSMVPLAGTYYNELPVDSFSTANMAAFFALVVLLSTLAVRNFKRRTQIPESIGKNTKVYRVMR